MNKRLLCLLAALYPSFTLAADGTQSLMDIYRLAQSSDPAWASARSAHLAAQEKLVQGRALTLPSVSLDGYANHTQTDLTRESAGFAISRSGFDKYETYGYSVNVTQPLYRKQNSIQYEQSKTQVAQADDILGQAEQELMLRVAEAYFAVLLAQDRIDLIAAQKTAIDQQLQQARANFEVGTATITDVHEAQARYDLILAQEIAAINDLEASKRAVQALTGQSPQRLAPAREDLAIAMPEPQAMEDWVGLAEQNSPAVRIQQQALLLASQEIERAQAGHLPTLDLVGSYTDNRANGGTSAELVGYNRSLKTGVLGVQFAVPLYQGGAITSRAREAVANKQKAQDDLESARRQAGLQTRQAWLRLSSSVAQVKAYQQALVSSQSQLDSTNLGYEVGVRTSVDVLNAQQQFYSAKRDLLQARYDYLLNVIRLKSAAGVLKEDDLGQASQQLAGA